MLDRGGDEVLDVLFAANVGRDRERSDRRGVTVAGFLVKVRQHDVRALPGEPVAQREPDTARSAGHDGHLVVDVHRWVLSAIVSGWPLSFGQASTSSALVGSPCGW